MSNCRGGIARKFGAEGRCRLCERPASVRPLTRHRVVPGSLGGPYAVDNVVPLCRVCHDLIDGPDSEARAESRRMLRVVLWPVEVAFARRWLRGRFDDLYPASPALRIVSETIRNPARHLRACKASAGGCAYGCPVAANREMLDLAVRQPAYPATRVRS